MNASLIMSCLESVRAAMPGVKPQVAIILGSGWRDVGAAFHTRKVMSYTDMPGLGAPLVPGHAGQLVWAEWEGVTLIVFVGRRHWYEGGGWGPVAMPVGIAHGLGAKTLILTNSAGGIREDLAPGTLMVLDDHINAMGVNPLVGAHDSLWGPRFPDMSHVYDPDLRKRLERAAQQARVSMTHGVYVAVSGPSYETPAEIRAFRGLGADAVGMSTVPEAILARAAGLRVAGLSCITNTAAGLGRTLSHHEVLLRAAEAIPDMSAVLRQFVALTAQESRS